MRPSLTALAAVFGCMVAASLPCPAPAADPLLWDGLFADGTRVTGVPITGWSVPAAQPQLDGKPIFDAANPVRWVVRQAARPATADLAQPFFNQPYLELACGDRLPGVVTEHVSGVDDWRNVTPPHLLVQPLAAIDLPGRPGREQVRVASEQVRRIVFQHRPGSPPPPASIVMRDGREIRFRSLRFSGRGLIMLGEDGTQRLAFDEIAELRMPDRDPWNDYVQMVAWLAPQSAAAPADGLPVHLTRAETDDGLVVTSAGEPLRGAGDPNNPATWHLLAQPAWSLDPLWLRHAAVWRRLVFPVHEVPLSLIEPADVVRQGTFGTSWGWQRDRNVQGGPLTAARLPFGHGFGVQARCELTFPLPAYATAVRSGVALDDLAAAGGCVRASVHEGAAAAKPLWQSEFLVGSREPRDTGSLPLTAAAASSRTIVLVADAAHEGRPAGADPEDIRDMVDWLDPVVSLAPEGLARAVRERLPATIAAWRDWEVEGDPVIRTAVDPLAPTELPLPLRQSLVAGGETVLRRRLEVSADTPHLVVAVSRTATPVSRVEIRIDGVTVAEAEVPERKAGAAILPFALPLARFAGREVSLEVVHRGSDDKSFVEWGALGPTDALAWLWRPLPPVAAVSEGKATLRVLADGSVLAGGTSPAKDVYTLEIDTDLEKITGLRLEALRDGSLPTGGPGRAANGNFFLCSLTGETVSRVDSGRKTPLAFTKATATYSHPGHGPEAIIDASPGSGWAVFGAPKQVEPAVMLTLAQPVGFPGGTRLTLVMRYPFGDQHVLGRFRLAATTAPPPHSATPATILEDKAAAAANPSPAAPNPPASP